MESDITSFQCSAEFNYKTKMAMGMGTGVKQDYGKGSLIVEKESLSFKPVKEPKIKGGLKGGMLKSLASTNISIYPHPVMKYRDVKELSVRKKKELLIIMHAPYSVNPLTGKEVLAMPAMKTDMILHLKFDDSKLRDSAMESISYLWQPHRRSEAEVGYGAASPTEQPVTVTRTVSDGSGGFCTNCGEPVSQGQKFCGKCGNPI